MINLGDKLYYTIDWYELLIEQEKALVSTNYELAAQLRDRIIKLQSTKADVYKVVLLDISSAIGVNLLIRSDKLLRLIQYYEEERNNRLNSILGKY